MKRTTRCCSMGCAVVLVLGSLVSGSVQAPADVDQRVDAIFSRWTRDTPGCAVGASAGDRPISSRAYGMADLERDVPNSPATIFEAGSVSKQFTAAAVLLLVRDGKLSLDDPARRYIPELPDYGTPLTVRHMLQHTSGLRDWGSVEAIAGWPRTSRVNTHAHVLEIVSRQRALNFVPGTRWSYSNSGYNLAASLVSRVSGLSFAEFTRTRIFEPLGMSDTSWRDDHTRIVKGRALAYSPAGDGFRIQMPFENVHGNGGLLTTVGDLLRWNEHFTSPRLADSAFVAEQEQPGTFLDGRAHDYALGLTVGAYKGVRQVDHSGSTAGYRAHLARYPDARVSVAVLCNAANANATEYARTVAELFLQNALRPDDRKAAHGLTDAEAGRLAGLYRHRERGLPIRVTRDGNGLRVERGTALIAMAPTRFVTAGGQAWEFDGNGEVRVTDRFGLVETLERVEPARPTLDQLQDFPGTYTSEEASTAFTAAIDGEALVLRQRPDRRIPLEPVYADAFTGESLGVVIFRRDAAGTVTGFSLVQDRVWDLRFAREVDRTSAR